MLFGKAVKIENCAACHDQSAWLCYTWIHVDRPLNINARPIEQHFFLLFDCKSRNQHQQVARPGDQEYIFGRPRPNVSRLRRPGAVRAQPWFVLRLYDKITLNRFAARSPKEEHAASLFEHFRSI